MSDIFLRNFGQIDEIDLSFGDLTVIIGPQASGKSIFLQLFKLLHDHPQIGRTLKKQGFDWREQSDVFLDLYFGENLHSLWHEASVVQTGTKVYQAKDFMKKSAKAAKEKVFYIPAQRVVTLENGWPRPFTGFRAGDPYVVKNFSENLRLLMEAGMGGDEGRIFPQDRRLKKTFREILDQTIFHGAQVHLDRSQAQRRIVLKTGELSLPFMTWSAGQREFMPLLLGLYWLMPPSAASKKPEVDWVIIEEPEMGLHPRAIIALILVFLELISRGYKLIISTHSPVIPQAIWAIQTIRELQGDSDRLFELFGLEQNPGIGKVFQDVFTKTCRTYYFDPQPSGVRSRDISTLDPADEAPWTADWGGLTEFSSQASEVISNLAMEQE